MGLIWVIALLFAIPTFGISIVIAIVINVYVNNQKKQNVKTAIAVGLSLFAIESVSKYHMLIHTNNLITSMSDEEITHRVLETMMNIEEFLLNYNRFENKTLLQELAIRFVALSEQYHEDDLRGIIHHELNEVAQFGAEYVIHKPFPG